MGKRYISHGNQGAITKIRNSYWEDKGKNTQITLSQEFSQQLKKLLEDHILAGPDATGIQAAWEPESTGPCRVTCEKHRGLLMLWGCTKSKGPDTTWRRKPSDDYNGISCQPSMLTTWYLMTKIYVTTHIIYSGIRNYLDLFNVQITCGFMPSLKK